ncbi:MAG: hypothetical protein HC810_01975 [Acaryochloridaceae cyanobacterium RL_2_7]|nr:hypothetical protein [Acaryochloridaceae cyanobacterium RL_2_7]
MVWTLTQPPSTPEENLPGNGVETLQTSENSNKLDPIELATLPSPNFQRPAQAPDNSAPDVTLVSATPNLITDTSTWFQKHGLSLPTYIVPNPVRNENGNIPEGVEDRAGSDRS